MTKVYLLPKYRGEDNGDGGIRRVVEAQYKYLPSLGIQFVDSEREADVIALHAGMWVETDKPVIEHCHGLYWKEYEWPLWARKLNREVADNIRRADVVTVPSQWVGRAVAKAFGVEPLVLHHGVEDIGLGEKQDYVLWNKTRADSVCTVYEVEELARREQNVKFISTFGSESSNLTVVGRQPYEDGIRTLLGSSVYLGTTKETFGVGILEAMVAGVPVLSWDWGGQAEVIKHKETGYLVRPGDFDGLQEGLRYCLEYGTRLGMAAREFVLDNYLWKKQIEPYAELYSSATRSCISGISVVVPCYNLGRYLVRAVDSAIACGADEVIIVDDASTDNTLVIAAQLVAEHKGIVKLVRNSTNQHVSASRNLGIQAAKYEYIVTLDADDYLVNLEVLRDALDRNRNLDIAYGAIQFVDENNVPVQAVGPDGVSDWPFEFKYRGLHTFPVSYCPIVSMFRKSIWERTGGYRERYKGVEDADFYTRALSLGCKAAKVTSSVTFVYTMRQDSLSHTEKKIDWTQWYPKSVSIPPEGDIQIASLDPVQISIIIPVGPGHERLVLDALDSVWAQSFERWECTVVNDTGAYFWTPSWVSQVSTGDRASGPARARNLGIEASVGKYIYFLDADDYLQLNALELLVNKIKQEENIFVYGDWFEAETGKIHQSIDCVCEESLHELLTAINIMYPRESQIRFDETLKGWEDWDFVLQLHREGYQGLRVAQPLFNYRIRSGSRREELYADRENLKLEMYNKWHEYIRGEKKLACGACGSKPRTPMAVRANIPQNGSNDVMLVEYVGASQGTKTFTGKATGRLYRFGNDPDHKVKLVFKEDVPSLISLSELQEFKGAEATTQLVTS